MYIFSSVQLLSRVQLFATPWTTACQASLSITNSWSLLKLTSIGLVMPSNHLILCRLSPSPLALNLSQHQSLYQWVSSSHQVAKVLEFQLQHQSFQRIFRVDFLGIDWLDLLAVQKTLKSPLQYHSSNSWEEKLKAKEKMKDIPIWMQSSKEEQGEIRKPSSVIGIKK